MWLNECLKDFKILIFSHQIILNLQIIVTSCVYQPRFTFELRLYVLVLRSTSTTYRRL